MTREADTRTQAEETFQQYLDLFRQGKAPSEDEFIAKLPEGQRREVRKMLEDYRALRSKFGEVSPALESGKVLGDFKLVREIGRGGMAVVWEADQLSLNRKVAAKLLLPHYALSSSTIEKFAREARAGGRLAHPGIVQTYGVGETDGVHWIAQELVPGGYTLADSLADLREGDKLPDNYYEAVAELFAKVADALQYAHDQGVIHRDVKPSNILITDADEPRVVDFGLAKIQDELGLSRTGEVEGTPYYMSPEQASAKVMGVDHRTDVFSLGATLYEALTLTRAFDGDTSQHVFRKILTVDPPDPRVIRSRVPPDLGVICMHALEKDPRRRYPSLSELAADLRHVLDHEPIVVKPPGFVVRWRKWSRRHPTLAASAALGVVLLASSMGFVVKLRSERDAAEAARHQAFEARRVSQQALGEALRSSYAANVHAAAGALQGEDPATARAFLSRCPEELRGWEWRYYSMRADQSIRVVRFADILKGELASYEVADCLVFDATGTLFLTGFSDGTVGLWEFKDCRLLSLFEGHSDSVTAVAFVPDKPWIVSGSSDATVAVWDQFSGKRLATMNTDGSAVLSVAIHPKGTQLVAGCEDSRIRVFEPDSASKVATLGEHDNLVLSVAYSPDGACIASGGNDGNVFLWNAESFERLTSLGPYQDAVTEVVFSPDGGYLAMSSFDGLIRIWDVTKEEFSMSARREMAPVALAYTADGGRLVVGSVGNTVHLLDTESGEEVTALRGHEEDVLDVAVSPKGRWVLSSSDDRTLRIWDAGVPTDPFSVDGHDDGVSSLAFSMSGAALVSGSDDHSIKIWQATSAAEIGRLDGHEGAVTSVAIHPDERRIISASKDGTVRVWDAMEFRELSVVIESEAAVNSVCVSRDGTLLASGSDDGTIRVWPMHQLETSRVFAGHDEAVNSVQFSADSQWLVSSSSDRSARIWDVESGHTRGAPLRHGFGVTAAVFAPDGRRVASGSGDGSVRVWDSETGEQLSELRGHGAYVTDIVFSPNGERIVSASWDETLRVWSPLIEQPLAVFFSQSAESWDTVAFSPDGRRIVAGSALSGNIFFFDTDLEDALGLGEH